VSDIPAEAEELYDSESLGQARDLIEAELGAIDTDQIRNMLDEMYSPEALTESARKLLPAYQPLWEEGKLKLAKEQTDLAMKLQLTQERLTSVLADVSRLQSTVADLELDEQIFTLRTEEDLMRTREFIHQWTEVCETQRRRKRELVAQIVA
jgi:hypothetical protein